MPRSITTLDAILHLGKQILRVIDVASTLSEDVARLEARLTQHEARIGGIDARLARHEERLAALETSRKSFERGLSDPEGLARLYSMHPRTTSASETVNPVLTTTVVSTAPSTAATAAATGDDRFVILESVSHTHGLSRETTKFIYEKFGGRTGFFIESVELPEGLDAVDCGLYGPIMGDPPVAESDVVYAQRPPRTYESRMVARPMRKTRTLTVIAGPHASGGVEYGCVLYTAFGGPLMPKEPGDATLTAENRDFSERLWAEHALSLESIESIEPIESTSDGEVAK